MVETGLTFTHPSAILWDMDGVLADTTELHFQTWRLAMADLGITLEREQFLPFFGRSPLITLNGLLGPKFDESTRREIRNRKVALFKLAPTAIQPTPGVLSWLMHFSKHSSQAVASSAPPGNIILVLDLLNIRPYFQTIVSGSEKNGKPDPAVFLRAAKELSTLPESCLVIEDSPSGVEAANRAGIPVIAICTSNPPNQLHHADLVLPDLSSLSLEIFQHFCQCHYKIYHSQDRKIVNHSI